MIRNLSIFLIFCYLCFCVSIAFAEFAEGEAGEIENNTINVDNFLQYQGDKYFCHVIDNRKNYFYYDIGLIHDAVQKIFEGLQGLGEAKVVCTDFINTYNFSIEKKKIKKCSRLLFLEENIFLLCSKKNVEIGQLPKSFNIRDVFHMFTYRYPLWDKNKFKIVYLDGEYLYSLEYSPI